MQPPFAANAAINKGTGAENEEGVRRHQPTLRVMQEVGVEGSALAVTTRGVSERHGSRFRDSQEKRLERTQTLFQDQPSRLESTSQYRRQSSVKIRKGW